MGTLFFSYAWHQGKQKGLAQTMKAAPVVAVGQYVEAEFPVLLRLTKNDVISSHSILAAAHALVQKLGRGSVRLPVNSQVGTASLVSYAIALAASTNGLDADELRIAYRKAHSIPRQAFVQAECHWV